MLASMSVKASLIACLALAGHARRMQMQEHDGNQPCIWAIEPKSGLVVLVMDDNKEDVERCMLEAARAGINTKPLQPCRNRSPTPVETLASFLLASAPGRAARRTRVRSLPQMSTGLYYSTSTGNTETVAEYIANAAGVEDWKDIADADDAEITGHDSIIVGAPTWHTGADSERSGTSWDEWLYNTLPNLDFSGKKVAIFGVGDSSGYGDNYCDATGELYDCFTGKGAKVFGSTPSDTGFDYTESKGVVDGKFVGVVFDEDNYGDESEARANAWVDQLKSEGFM